MLKFKKFVQDGRHVQIILSSTDDQEFKDLEEFRETIKTVTAKIQSKVETNAARLEENRKLMHQFEETLETQENIMKIYRKEVVELQKKMTDTEKRLKKSRKQIEQNREEMNRLMKEKESLMISDESDESRRKAACFSEDARFIAATSFVRWATGGHSHEITGCIFEPHKVKCFSYDKREKSQFFICNRLWETMDPSDDWKELVSRKSHSQEDVAASRHSQSVHVCYSEG